MYETMANLFIVGSGFTAAATGNNTPLNSGVLDALSPGEPHLVANLRSYDATDIEVALTKLDMEILRHPQRADLAALRKKTEESLASYFARFRIGQLRDLQTKQPWLNDFVHSAFARDDVVISLNYDCLLEGLLDANNLWTPNGGYGKGGAIETVQVGDAPSPVTVLKLHGSENFHREDIVGNSDTKAFFFSMDASLFPVSGKQRHFCMSGVNATEAIIAPSFVKVFPSSLICLFLDALKTADEATTVVVIGCSLRPEDCLLSIILWRFVQGFVRDPRRPPRRRIVILDPEADEVAGRLCSNLEYSIDSMIVPIARTLADGYSDLAQILRSPESGSTYPQN
jgi:hypothetical protein